MRYLLPTALLIFTVCISSYGQFEPGDKVLGGSVDLSTEHYPANNSIYTYKNKSLTVSPSFGILLNENMEVGVQVGYSTSLYETTSNSVKMETRSNGVAPGFYLRRYFRISDNFLFSLSGDANYSTSKYNNKTTNIPINTSVEIEAKEHGIDLSIFPSFIFLPSDHWALQASIGSIQYSHTKTLPVDSKRDHFDLSYGIIYLGLSYYIRNNE